MGFRFRKSKKVGPIRVTVSNSGVSTSIGGKGARITKRADGKIQTTASIPGTGISHTTIHNSTPQPQKNPPKKQEFLDTWFGKLITLGIIIGAVILAFMVLDMIA